jgi:hypothetical protein
MSHANQAPKAALVIVASQLKKRGLASQMSRRPRPMVVAAVSLKRKVSGSRRQKRQATSPMENTAQATIAGFSPSVQSKA